MTGEQPPQSVDGVVVDVGIPTHGHPRFLEQAIESVLAQSLEAWQLTISANGIVGDEIASIVEPYLADPRVRHVSTQRSVGGAINSTSLIQAGRAPYVAILHDDDRWDPGFLARRVAFLEAHPACGLVFSPCDLIDDDGKVIGRYDPRLPEGEQDRGTFLRKLYRENLLPVCSVLVRRSAYDAVGPEFNDQILFWDYEMWVRLAARFGVGFEATPDSAYRLHGAQTSQRESPNWWEHHVRVLDEIASIAPPEVSRLELKRTRFAMLVRAAVEAHRRGDRRSVLAWLGRAARAHPLAPLDPVMLGRVLRRLGKPAGTPTTPLRPPHS